MENQQENNKKEEKYYYTGIGSRSTPKEILDCFASMAKWFAENGFILRSGGADGADDSFEWGCDYARGKKEIYLPWNGFNGRYLGIVIDENDKKAFELAEQFHPNWSNLGYNSKKLIARDGYQVLGKDLNTHSLFVLCYTESGSGKGGTGQAIRIAKHYNIPVFDAGLYNSVKDYQQDVWDYLMTIGRLEPRD